MSFRIRSGENARSVGAKPAYWPFWTSTNRWSVLRAGLLGLLVGFLGPTVCQEGSSRDSPTITQSVSRGWVSLATLAKVCFLALLVLAIELADLVVLRVLVVLASGLVVLAVDFASWSVLWAIFRVVFSRLAT